LTPQVNRIVGYEIRQIVPQLHEFVRTICVDRCLISGGESDNTGKNGVELSQPFCECGWAGVENVGRLDLVALSVTNCADVRPAFATANQLLLNLPATP